MRPHHALLVILCVKWLHGCAAAPSQVTDPLSAAPDDFAIELSVLAAPDLPMQTELHRRSSRLVLLPDGALHYGVDPKSVHGASWLPPLTRILSRRQVAEVWSVARQLGFTDPQAGQPPTNFDLVAAQPGSISYVAAFTGWGERWQFVRRAPVAEPADPAMQQLVERLAHLAWVDADAAAHTDVRILPKRYDHGPDPYAKYRKSESP